MKKKLLLFIFPILLISLSIKAQNHTWDFSDSTIWPVATGLTTDRTVDGLNIIAGGSATGTIAASSVAFSDGFTSVNAMSNGSATLTGVIPTKRGLSFPVSGPCTISVWVSTSSTGRIASISDGTTVLNSYTSASPSPYKTILTASYTGGVGTIYVYSNNTMVFAKISVAYGPLSTNEFKNETATVFSDGNQIMVSNVKSNTTIAIYAITGALVKTIETNSDTNFSLNPGFFIAKVKSAEGEKSVKLFVK